MACKWRPCPRTKFAGLTVGQRLWILCTCGTLGVRHKATLRWSQRKSSIWCFFQRSGVSEASVMMQWGNNGYYASLMEGLVKKTRTTLVIDSCTIASMNVVYIYFCGPVLFIYYCACINFFIIYLWNFKRKSISACRFVYWSSLAIIVVCMVTSVHAHGCMVMHVYTCPLYNIIQCHGCYCDLTYM